MLRVHIDFDVVMTKNIVIKRKLHLFLCVQNIRKILFTAMLIASTPLTFANDQLSQMLPFSSGDGACLTPFYRDVPPLLNKESLKKNSYAFCLNGFNVMYSGVSKTPLWSAEYLTPERFSSHIKREDNFHEEMRVQADHRALLTDYRASGYDRGHMAPSGDMTNSTAQFDSFSLINIVPQSPKNNQEAWRKIEEAIREIVRKQKNDVYVITGPVFEGKRLQTIGQGVFVPTAIYKAIYLPKQGVIGAYYAPNNDSQQVQVMSVCELEERLGMNLFPQLPEKQKRNIYNLPLSASQVKANREIAYSHWDGKSQCAEDATTEQIQAQQQQFIAQPAETMESKFPTIDEATKQALIQQLVNALVQYFLQLLK